MKRVNKGDRDKAKELLQESFSRQDSGTFNAEYMSGFIPKMLKLIKPEYTEEVRNIMAEHKA